MSQQNSTLKDETMFKRKLTKTNINNLKSKYFDNFVYTQDPNIDFDLEAGNAKTDHMEEIKTYIGRKIRKLFPTFGWFNGTIKSYNE